MDETNKFLGEFEIKDKTSDLLDAPLIPNNDGQKPKVEDEDNVPDDVKNRRHRRLEQKYEAERIANIQLNAKLQAQSEVQKMLSENRPAEYLTGIEKIYGTDTPEAIAATELLKKAFVDVKEVATNEALQKFRDEQEQSKKLLRQEEAALDNMVEDIEDEYGVDLSSDSAADTRKTFFKMMEKMSPKDQNGQILNYADHRSVWEIMKERSSKRTENRAKDLSYRSMVQSGSPDSKLQDDATLRFLKDNDII